MKAFHGLVLSTLYVIGFVAVAMLVILGVLIWGVLKWLITGTSFGA